ncbi:glutamyl-tRNA reductase [Actinomadura darangshiensis]|uniref:Glutamyl-tRNA reductase n=1 Tax=Actinomadura darangshiensis TaxID=705336 RepID=A0A4R5BU63_9ACTN|nr:glutamyl-tRNA reductase [Actinomadura darangshiensis]TDD89609.1 glutamyl-tRNA reductase [Actinomadura darangshiensis]
MTLVATGLSHRSTDIGMLEQFALDRAQTAGLRGKLSAAGEIGEVVVLATCNRVEVYADTADPGGALGRIRAELAEITGADELALAPHLYGRRGRDAVRHLFRVACGLDSMLVGEAQIRGQVRDAYADARAEAAVGPVLHDLFQQAFRLGKRAESELGIGRMGASLVEVGLRAGGGHLGTLRGRRALVVGAGAMGALAATALADADVAEIVIANRTPARARRVAAQVGGRARGLAGLDEAIARSDVVVATAAAGEALLTAGMFPSGRPMFVLDLSMPRSAEPEVGKGDGILLVDLEALGERLRGERAELPAESAERMVDAEVEEYARRERAAAAKPAIVAMRTTALAALETELTRFHQRVPSLSADTRSEVDSMARRLVDKFLHRPTVRVKSMAAAENPVYVQVLRDLFDPDHPAGGIPGNVESKG